MRKVANLSAAILLTLSLLPTAVGAETTAATEILPGQLVRASNSPAVYYIDVDLQRYVFPNANVYSSWYADFGGVVTVSNEVIAQYPLAGVVPYKAASRLIKVKSDPKVYAVDDGGVLRWIKSEQVAKALYGDDWAKHVDDLSDAFFVDYSLGEDIDDDKKFERSRLSMIREIRHVLREHRLKRLRDRGAHDDDMKNEGWGRSRSAVCHKGTYTLYLPGPAISAHVKHGDAEGKCANDNGNGNNDTTKPVVSSVTVGTITLNSAKVTVKASEEVTAKAFYSTSTPVNVSSASHVDATSKDDEQVLSLTGLDANTTYYVKVVVRDAAGNEATADEKNFKTLSSDTTDPTVSASSVDTITQTGAKVHVTTNEDVTVKAYYATSSPVNVSSASHVDATTLDDSHDLSLTGLTADTTYYVKIVVRDAAGNETTVDEKTFMTLASS